MNTANNERHGNVLFHKTQQGVRVPPGTKVTRQTCLRLSRGGRPFSSYHTRT